MKLALISLIVRDYDEAIDWYTRVLGFRLAQNEDQGGKRWVVIEADQGSALLLAKAKNEREAAAIGNQHAGVSAISCMSTISTRPIAASPLAASPATRSRAPRAMAWWSCSKTYTATDGT